jgi:hypothetical protein
MAPPADQLPGGVQFLADLSLEISDGQGRTTAHVSADGSNLVLDVADPIVLVRAWPGGGLRALSRRLPTDALGAASLDISSRGRRLATVTVSARRRVRIRPTWAGLVTTAKPVLSSRAGRLIAAVLATAAVAASLRRLRRRQMTS